MSGSSPQAWGTQMSAILPNSAARFIPTGVGNTNWRGRGLCCFSVHPHRRGEHDGEYFPKLYDWRFIPTGVGNTTVLTCSHGLRSVHPHRRGEHVADIGGQLPTGGSSPQAWGTPGAGWPGYPQERFIPTGVGNTGRRQSPCRPCPVHPHRRGEHQLLNRAASLDAGSSPQAWGTRLKRALPFRYSRFIPTGVGNTLPLSP